MSTPSRSYLRRLDSPFYKGHAIVHWSMTIDQRKTGWLNTETHLSIRELLLHTASRYHQLAPTYGLMPDHLHILWMGTDPSSDQLRAASFFRKHLNFLLRRHQVTLMEQAYDHVLKEHEREKGAFESMLFYITENPARAKLVEKADNWEFSGSAASGYPDFDWRDDKFTEKLWKIYALERSKI